jgi:hypothetical protein
VKPARQSFLLLMTVRWALPPRPYSFTGRVISKGMLPMKNDIRFYVPHYEAEQQDGANLNALCSWKQARYEKAHPFRVGGTVL